MERTPRSRIKGMLRQIFLKSRERANCLKRDNYTCQNCGVKQSKKKGYEQKVEVHHIKGISVWNDVIEMIYNEILCTPDKLKTLCPDCHREIEE